MPPLLPVKLVNKVNGIFQSLSSTNRLPVEVANVPGQNLDVMIGDQTSPAINWYGHRDIATTALTNPVSIGDKTATLDSVAAINLVTGSNFLLITNGVRFQFVTVLSLPGGNVINIDSPFTFAYQAGTTVIILNREINVNGSITPVTFHLTNPIPNSYIDLTQIRIEIHSAAEPDDSLFGGIAALTNGVVIQAYINGILAHIGNAKTNGGLTLFTDIEYTAKAGGGNYNTRISYYIAGQENMGVAVRLGYGDEIRIIVQDDLTSLLKIRMAGKGHFVV